MNNTIHMDTVNNMDNINNIINTIHMDTTNNIYNMINRLNMYYMNYTNNMKNIDYIHHMNNMNIIPKSITGFLIFTKPNKYTTESYGSYLIRYQCSCNSSIITPDEIFLVATRSGTSPFNQDRLDEYLSYRRCEITMDEIVFKHYPNINMEDYYSTDEKIRLRETYLNKLWRRWFGDYAADNFSY